MKSTSFMLVILLIISLSFSAVAFAANNKTSQISKAELKALLKSAKTPVEHRRIAEYYQHQAERLTAEARSHEEMGQIYPNTPLPFEAKHPYGTVGLSHCQYWAQFDLRQAKKAESLAILHEDMAKAAEQK